MPVLSVAEVGSRLISGGPLMRDVTLSAAP
jgi:hypothetical protein